MNSATNAAAQTIAAQIGRPAFAMMGAKDLLDCGGALQWSIGRNAQKVTKVRVAIASDDTYTVSFYAGRGVSCREVAEVGGVYADSLRRVIESNTGLYLNL